MAQLVVGEEERELLLPTSRVFVTKLLGELDGGDAGLQDRATDTSEVQISNPLNNVEEKTKKQLLALQVLFPNEFVPALDLLDRHLVTRFRIRQHQDGNAPVSEPSRNESAEEPVDDEPMRDIQMDTTTHQHNVEDADTSLQDSRTTTDQTTTTTTDTPQTTTDPNPPTYYVRSAQQRSSRYSTSFETTTYYQVRLQAWNCSCPAFAFAAFPAVHPEPAVPMYNPCIEYSSSTSSSSGNGDSVGVGGLGGNWTFGGVSLGENMPPVCKHLLACVLVEKCKGLFGGFVEERDVSVQEAAGWAAGWGD